MGFKHTTASNDAGCFSIPPKAPAEVVRRLKPIVEWHDNPHDAALEARFGTMAYKDFLAWRKGVIEDEEPTHKSKSALKKSGKDKDKGKSRKRSQRDSDHEERKYKKQRHASTSRRRSSSLDAESTASDEDNSDE